MMKLAAKVAGEPWVSFYTPEEMEEVLSQCGFRVNEAYFGAVGPEEQLMKLERFVVAKK